MRSYGQYCAVAKALDVIGDRWTLLIVRELLLRGTSRYTDLRNGLPGIATNLLADRLRNLEENGIVRREAAPPPIATTVFQLTDRGEELRPVLKELGRWGAPLMFGPADDEAFRGHWFSLPAELFLTDNEPDGRPITIELRAGEEPMLIETADGEVHARPGTAEHADAVITGTPRLVLDVLTAQLELSEARALGLRYDGNPAALNRIQPRVPATD
jgi:DNA-binding HxlR family transcriptional regulator